MNKNISPAYCWATDHNVKFKLKIGSYPNIIEFLNSSKIEFLANIELPELPKYLLGNGRSKNLLEYISNNSSNNILLYNFLNYYIVSIIKIRYISGEPLLYAINVSDK
jgi:hypothetical protein